MIIKNFEQWLAEDVERSFGIERIRPQEHIGMQVWLEAQNHNAELSSNVKRLQNLLADNVDIWNEDELKIMFIGPLLIDNTPCKNDLNFKNKGQSVNFEYVKNKTHFTHERRNTHRKYTQWFGRFK